MTEATIICTHCGAENRLTESLAAPLLAATRKQFEQQLQQKDTDIAQREHSIRNKEKQLLDAQRRLEDQVAEQVNTQLATERQRIITEENRKAKQAAAAELEHKTLELTDLQNILKIRDIKLAEAQQAQAELIKKQRELDDEKRELQLTVEKRIHDSLADARNQAKQEADSIRKQFEHQLSQKDQDIHQREQRLRNKEAQLTAQLKTEREKIIAEESHKAKLAAATELDNKARELIDLQHILKSRDIKLAEAQQAQAELITKQRELDDQKRELELTVAKRIQDGLDNVRSQARKEAEENQKFLLMEKNQTISAMQQKIEELKQKAEQGSQQLQGEVQELELENLLRIKFPFDDIEPVAKGEFGGDVLQRIVSAAGQSGTSILWEAKRTKNWSDGWLVKLREDQRNAKSDVAVLVSHALPKGVETFDVVDGIWVTSPKAALPVATILRDSLLQISMARMAAEGQQGKTEMVYQYLTGPRFRQRVEAIVEAFSTMQEDLDKERKAIMKQWAKREAQIERVMNATVGMYGDLQGIAGKSLQEIDGLEIATLGLNND